MKRKPFTNAQFAQRAALIAKIASGWARDLLDNSEEPAKLERIETFGEEIADALDRLLASAEGRQ